MQVLRQSKSLYPKLPKARSRLVWLAVTFGALSAAAVGAGGLQADPLFVADDPDGYLTRVVDTANAGKDEKNIQPSGYYTCRELGRLLSDQELLDIVYEYEIENFDTVQGYANREMAEIVRADPQCCSVLRETNPHHEIRTWYQRLRALVIDPPISVAVGWGRQQNGLWRVIAFYDVTVCGEVYARRYAKISP